MDEALHAAVLTVSDGVSSGHRLDTSGDVIATRLVSLGFAVVTRRVVPDEPEEIAAAVRDLSTGADLVVSTGGTGLMPRDVTPQTVQPLVDYVIPGFGEAMRARGLQSTPNALLSRQFGAVLGRTLVLCLPGSPGAVGDCLDALGDVLLHAVQHLLAEPVHDRAD